MNFNPGDDRRYPPRERRGIGVHDGRASKKSKKRQQGQNRTSRMSGTTEQACPLFSDEHPEYIDEEYYYLMKDPALVRSILEEALGPFGDSATPTADAVAQAGKRGIGVHDGGASKKSKKRQQGQNRTFHMSGTAEQACPLFSDEHAEYEDDEYYDLMKDPAFVRSILEEALGPFGDSANPTADAVAQAGKRGIGVHDGGASKKSKKRQQGQNRTFHMSGTAEQACPLFSDEHAEYEDDEYYDLMKDPAFVRSILEEALGPFGDSANPRADAVAQAAPQAKVVKARAAHDSTAQNAAGFWPASHPPNSISGSSSATSHSVGNCNSGNVSQCPHCSRRYAGLGGLRRHLRRDHDKGSLRHCHKCRFTSSDYQIYRHHMHTHARRFRCSSCGEKNTFQEHVKHAKTCRRRGFDVEIC